MTKIIAYGYARCSTDIQKEKGLSIKTQKQLIEDYCNENKYDLKKIFVDEALTGSNMERENIQELLKEVKKGNFIIVTELSRITRDMADTWVIVKDLRKKGIHIYDLDTRADYYDEENDDKILLKAWGNQQDIKKIKKRVSNGMIYLSSKNELRSRPPFGYKYVGKESAYEKDEEQQKVIEIIKDLYVNKKMKTNKISTYLNENGHNKCLIYGKKKMEQLEKKGKADKEPKFYCMMIKRILADQGILKMDNRKPISERFLDSRKKLIE